jgi:hypothetical protein
MDSLTETAIGSWLLAVWLFQRLRHHPGWPGRKESSASSQWRAMGWCRQSSQMRAAEEGSERLTGQAGRHRQTS